MVKYKNSTERIYTGKPFEDGPLVFLDPTSTSKNKLAFVDTDAGVYLYQANCLEVMDALSLKYPDGCFDMIFADPPYFLSNGGITCHAGKMVKVDKGEWDKSRGPDLNHEFNTEWLRRCQKLLKPNGTIWISGTMHIIFSIGYALQQLKFKVLNDIIWQKTNPPPNLACRYFTHSSETLIWAAKNEKSKHVFNYALMKATNGGKQMQSVWRIAASGREEKVFGKHPTQKPVPLIERCILASTHEGDFVFDPFSGSATTGIAAVRASRRFCGVETETEFINLSVKRLKDVLGKGEGLL